jgi:hypothetical protein
MMDKARTIELIVFPIIKTSILKNPRLHWVVAIPMVFWLVGAIGIVKGELRQVDLTTLSIVCASISVFILLVCMYQLKSSEIVVTEDGLIQVKYGETTIQFKNASIVRKNKHWLIESAGSRRSIKIPFDAFPYLHKASKYIEVRD